MQFQLVSNTLLGRLPIELLSLLTYYLDRMGRLHLRGDRIEVSEYLSTAIEEGELSVVSSIKSSGYKFTASDITSILKTQHRHLIVWAMKELSSNWRLNVLVEHVVFGSASLEIVEHLTKHGWRLSHHFLSEAIRADNVEVVRKYITPEEDVGNLAEKACQLHSEQTLIYLFETHMQRLQSKIATLFDVYVKSMPRGKASRHIQTNLLIFSGYVDVTDMLGSLLEYEKKEAALAFVESLNYNISHSDFHNLLRLQFDVTGFPKLSWCDRCAIEASTEGSLEYISKLCDRGLPLSTRYLEWCFTHYYQILTPLQIWLVRRGTLPSRRTRLRFLSRFRIPSIRCSLSQLSEYGVYTELLWHLQFTV